MKEARSARFLILLVALGLFLSVPLPAQDHKDIQNIGRRDINEGSWNLYSLEKEIELGRELAGEVEAKSSLLRNGRVTQYVNSVVQRLVRNSDARVPFTVKVIDSDELNAFALPGGYLYVNTGLLLEARTEAELAGVLAHEIAHVTARHFTRQATKRSIFQWVSLPLIIFGGPVGYGISQALGLAVPLSILKFKRNDERQADFLGLQYAYRAGYDPVGMIDFLERLRGEEGGRLAKLFSSHPMNEDRIERAQEAIGAVLPAREEYVVSTSRFDRVKSYVKALQSANWVYRQSEPGEPRLRKRTQEVEQ